MKRVMISIAILLAFSSVAFAQTPLRDGAAQYARWLAQQPQQPAPPAEPSSELDKKVSDGVITFSEGAFVLSQLVDTIHAIVVSGKTAPDGQPLYTQGNGLLPDSRVAMVAEKAAVAAAGVMLAETLKKGGHRWEAVFILAGAAGVTYASNFKTFMDELKAASTTSRRTIAVRFTLRR